jgi:ankyrin repeat protein
MDNIIKKCLKSYLTGVKYYDVDSDKSCNYFKQCIKIIYDLKENNLLIKSNYNDILNETETECSKYLTMTIEKTIEKPLEIKNINDINIFNIIETGDINEIKKYKYGDIDFTIYNTDGLTPLHYALKYGDASFLKYAFNIGGNIDQTNKFGHTLFEYACLEQDFNMSNFLIYYGVDIKKHIEFRNGTKYFNRGNQIDIVLLEKIIMDTEIKYTQLKYLDFVFDYIKKDDILDIGYCKNNNSIILDKYITFYDFIIKLDNLLNNLSNDETNTYINIIKEELKYNLLNKLECPDNKIHILLYNLVPFIKYNNLQILWLLHLEIKFLILKLLKNSKKINIDVKNNLRNIIYENYVHSNILSKGIIDLLIHIWFNKINV